MWNGSSGGEGCAVMARKPDFNGQFKSALCVLATRSLPNTPQSIFTSGISMRTEELQPVCCEHKSQVHSAEIRLEKVPLLNGQSQFCVAAGESHVAMKEAANERNLTELKRFRAEKQYNVDRSEEAATEAVLSNLGNISQAKEN